MPPPPSAPWQVDLDCPQCSAPLVLEETDRILACSYCRVRLFLQHRGPPRYCLPSSIPLSRGVFFAPYWRFRGMVFSVSEAGVQGRVADLSRSASAAGGLPFSLGLRPQVMRLRPVTPQIQAGFLAADRPFRRAGPRASQTMEAFIGEVLSLVYAPFQVRGEILVDAVLDRPVGKWPESARGGPREEAPTGSLNFLPLLCPACGWDLDGERDALVLLCGNCERAWLAGDEGFQEVSCQEGETEQDDALFLPFWCLRTEPVEGGAQTGDDSPGGARVAGTPHRGRRENPPEFWVPAFRVSPAVFLRLGRLFTARRNVPGGRGASRPGQRFPVTLPVREAAEFAEVVAMVMGMPQRGVGREGLADALSSKPAEVRYVPFSRRGRELVGPDGCVSIDSRLLQWARSG